MPGKHTAQEHLDLSSMVNSMRAAKNEAKKPELQAIIVPAGQGEALKAELDANTTSGLPAVIALKNEGDLDILLFTNVIDPEAATYTTGDAGICVGNVKKYVSTWSDSESFADNIAKSGLWSDIWNALSTADSTISNALGNSNTPEEATQKLESIMSDLNTHLMGVVKALPVTAYKAEKIVSAFSKALVAKAEADVAAAALKADGDVPAVVDTAVADPAAAAAAVADPVVATAEVPEATGAFDMSALLTQLGGMIDTKLANHAEKMDAKLAELGQATASAVEQTETTAAKADKAVKALAGIVVGATAENTDALPPAAVVQKSDAAGAGDSDRSWEIA